MAGTAAIVSAGAGLASAGNSIFGGGSGSTYGGNPATYIPQNQSGVDTNLNSIYSSLQGPATQLPPQLIQGYQQLYQNTQPFQQGATTTTAGPITSGTYFAQNPDVGQAWQQLSTGGADPAAEAWFQSLPPEARTSPDAFAQWHYRTFGSQENRQTGAAPTTTTAPDTGNPYSQGAQTSAVNTAALGQQQSQFNQNLAGDLWSKGQQQYNFNQPLQQPLATAGQQQYGIASGLQGQLQPGIGQLQQGGQALYQTAFDPQNALYDRTLGQVTDKQNAINSMYGLGNSAAGAGLTGDATRNFNIDWQNQQLSRQATGLQGLTSALGQAGSLGSTIAGLGQSGLQGMGNSFTAASNLGGTALTNLGRSYTGAGDLGNLGLNQQMATGGLPYSTYIGQQNDQAGALNNLTNASNNAYQLPQNVARLLGSYLGLGQSATGQGLQGQQQGFNQAGQLGQGLAGAVQGIGDIWGSGTQGLYPAANNYAQTPVPYSMSGSANLYDTGWTPQAA